MFVRSIVAGALAGLFALSATAPAFAADPIPVEDFWKRSSFRQVKISPDGRYLAATVPLENLTALVVMDLQSKKITGSFKPQEKAHIQDFYWVSPERLLFRSSVREGRFAAPSLIPAYYAMNADGSKVGTAYGDGRNPFLLDTLKNDDKFVLVQFRSKEGLQTYGKMNVENGTIVDTFKKPPTEAPGQYVTDNAAAVRLYVTAKSYKDAKVYGRASEKDSWTVIHDPRPASRNSISSVSPPTTRWRISPSARKAVRARSTRMTSRPGRSALSRATTTSIRSRS